MENSNNSSTVGGGCGLDSPPTWCTCRLFRSTATALEAHLAVQQPSLGPVSSLAALELFMFMFMLLFSCRLSWCHRPTGGLQMVAWPGGGGGGAIWTLSATRDWPTTCWWTIQASSRALHLCLARPMHTNLHTSSPVRLHDRPSRHFGLWSDQISSIVLGPGQQISSAS